MGDEEKKVSFSITFKGADYSPALINQSSEEFINKSTDILTKVSIYLFFDVCGIDHLFENSVITVRKRSCGKAMFSQARVKNSVHRGGDVHPLGRHPPGRHTPSPLADTPRQTPPRQMATTADCTHPTEMHSCFLI